MDINTTYYASSDYASSDYASWLSRKSLTVLFWFVVIIIIIVLVVLFIYLYIQSSSLPKLPPLPLPLAPLPITTTTIGQTNSVFSMPAGCMAFVDMVSCEQSPTRVWQ